MSYPKILVLSSVEVDIFSYGTSHRSTTILCSPFRTSHCLRIPPLPWTAAECIRSSAHVAISILAKQGDHLKRDSLSIKMTMEGHQQLLSTASVITMTSIIPPFPSCTPPPRAVSLIDLKSAPEKPHRTSERHVVRADSFAYPIRFRHQ